MSGLILATISLILSGCAQNITTLCFTTGIGIGVSYTLIEISTIVSVTMHFKRYRCLALGIALSGSDLGFVIFEFTGYLQLFKMIGWRNNMYIMSVLTFIGICYGMIFSSSQHEMLVKRKRSRIANSGENTYEGICNDNEDGMNTRPEITGGNHGEPECSSVANSGHVDRDPGIELVSLDKKKSSVEQTISETINSSSPDSVSSTFAGETETRDPR